MSMVHECEVCGAHCDCDWEDLDQPQPDECDHLTVDGACSGETLAGAAAAPTEEP